MKSIILVLLSFLISLTGSFAQEQKVKRSEIIETLRGVPYYIHFVSSGETIQSISGAYDISQEELIRANPEIADGLKTNHVLKIEVKPSSQLPAGTIKTPKSQEPVIEKKNNANQGKVHTIEPKETWYGLSRLYQVPVKELIASNPGIDTLKVGMQIVIPDFNDDIKADTKQAPSQHAVQAGETLYSISKMYNVTINELQNSNPGLNEGLKTGQLLNIPVSKEVKSGSIVKSETKKPESGQEQITQKEKPAKYKEHTVERKETLYGIAMKYGVEISDILKSNPWFDGDLKKGQVLRIPTQTPLQEEFEPDPLDAAEAKPETVVEKPAKLPCSPVPDISQQFNVALLIPFMLEEADSISLGDPASLRLPSEYESFDFIQFYEGALIAIDSLSKAGMNVRVHVFDTDAGEYVSKTRRILANPEMAKADLIIGPFFAKSFELVASFAASHSIPVINPLSHRSEILIENPYVFKAQPSARSQYSEAARYIADACPNSNVLIFRRNAEEYGSMASILRSVIADQAYSGIQLNEAIYSQSFDAGLFNNLVPGKKNVVFLLTSDKALLPALLRKMNDVRGKYDITLFGLPDWEDLELDNHYLLNLNTHIFKAWFVDYSQPAVKNFVSIFNERFKTEPEQDAMAFLGYDISFYFLNSLFNYGRDFIKCLGSMEPKGLSTGFTFRKTEAGGYENTASSVYVLKDYKRRLVNR